MRNQPCYLTTGGGNRPESLPTPWSRATRPIRWAGRVLKGPATPRFIAAVTALTLFIALALTTALVHLATAPHSRAGAAPSNTPTVSRAASASRGLRVSFHQSTAGAAASTAPGNRALEPTQAPRSTTEFTVPEAARLALRTTPGLVNITTEQADGGGEAGTGIVLSRDGLVLTAAHVLTDAVTVHALDLGDGQDYPATVIGADRRHDVALIQLHGASGLHLARLANPGTTALRVGDQVASLGNAYGRGYPTIGTGPVTAVRDTIDAPSWPGHQMGGLIAADNSILPGQSGGPMLNRAGAVIGMNDAYELASTGGSPTGVGFAIPIATALHIAHTLLAHYTQQTQL